jgi:hypothetical protein
MVRKKMAKKRRKTGWATLKNLRNMYNVIFSIPWKVKKYCTSYCYRVAEDASGSVEITISGFIG